MGVLLVLMLLVALVSKRASSVYRAANDPDLRTMGVGLLWAWSTLVLRSIIGMGGFVFTPWASTGPIAMVLEGGLVFWLILGLIMVAGRLAGDGEGREDAVGQKA